MAIPDYTSKDLKRFWSKVNKNGSIPAHRPELGACWEWTASCNRGYGCFGYKKKILKAHRIAWELSSGAIPSELYVLHKCDNPLCVNPDHLFLGTHQDNMDDKVKKDRQARGEKTNQSELTDTQIAYIRSRYRRGGISQQNLAKEMGISQSWISRILNRNT